MAQDLRGAMARKSRIERAIELIWRCAVFKGMSFTEHVWGFKELLTRGTVIILGLKR
jgi:hypothetical protein